MNNRFHSLEFCRGLAALGVCIVHAGTTSDAFTSGSDYSTITSIGGYGVDFFFALSGFIIYVANKNTDRGLSSARKFLGKRIKRIYIPYLPVALLMISVYTLLPNLSESDRQWGLITTLTLVPSNSPPALSVGWTLVYEMVFYVFFTTYFIFRNDFFKLVCFWLFITILHSYFSLMIIAQNPVLDKLFNLLVLEFIAGMLAGFLFCKVKAKAWVIYIVLSALALGVYFYFEDVHRAFLGIAFGSLILGLSLSEKVFSFPFPKIAGVMGASSYSIYLVHNPVQSVVGRMLAHYDVWLLTFVGCVIFGVTAGLFYYFIYDRPTLYFFSQKSGKHYPAD